MIVDEKLLFNMIDDFCTEKRPKSIDIKDMVRACQCKDKPVLQAKEFECKDYSSDSKVADSVKLNLAIEVFATMMEEMESVTIKDFLQKLMYEYGLSQYDILQDDRIY